MTHPASLPPDQDPGRWRTLALLVVAELLGMSLWFAATAVAPQYAAKWNLDASGVAWLTTTVQLGFVLGTATSAVLNLADILPARTLFAASALLGAAANASLLFAGSYRAALLGRLLTGFALAGVYPPAMKMIATWFKARRGLAVGAVVGALTVGKALPYLVHAFPNTGASEVVIASTASAIVAAILVALFYRDGPYAFPSLPFSWTLVGTVARQREWRLAMGGYLGHMFELYSAWTWLPVFVGASLAAAGTTSSGFANAVAFAALAIGGVGCVWGGLVADRIGRERLVNVAMAASGACALLIGFTFGRGAALLVLLALLWGFFVIADSAQFSVLAAESVPPHAVGTALTLQTSMGFLLTTVTIQLVPALAERVGWQWAFAVLALGPALGIASITRLVRVRGPT